MIEYQCSGECKQWLPSTAFSPDPTCKSGRRGECRECRRKKQNASRSKRRGYSGRPPTLRSTEEMRERVARELASLACAWKWSVDFNRPLRATIGGGYV